MEDEEQYYLTVGTEVSAKYRGAFCEAKIKSVKKSLLFRVSIKKDGKVCNVLEDSIKGTKKIGSTVEVQLSDTTGWHEGVVLGAKDKSTYTVEFDDGDVRTLSRGSLCLQGVRHFAEGDTLDQLPLTDPENFGTPVLNSKRKAKRKVTQASSLDIEDIESDDQKISESEANSKRKVQSKPEPKEEVEEESVDEKRQKWLADPLMGKLVLVEPTDKRKHWYPAVCVNPLSIEDYEDLRAEQIVVRSFKNGKLLIVERCEKLTRSNAPSKVEPQWKDVLENAFLWQENANVPDIWKSDLSEDEKKDEEKDDESESDGKGKEFLEQLYKFMEDRDTPITKPPVLGYKDLDLYLLYNLVQDKGGFSAINQSSDWKEIYTDLGIPKITPAAGHHAKVAYTKYLLCFEEYVMSFQQNKSQRESITKSPSKKSARSVPNTKSPRSVEDSDFSGRRLSRRRKASESHNTMDDNDGTAIVRETKRSRKSKLASPSEAKRDSDADEVSSTASSEKLSSKSKTPSSVTESKQDSKQTGRLRSNSGAAVGLRKHTNYKVGDKLRVKYGRDSFKLYNAKVVDVKMDSNNEIQYLVHYTGWNSRHDEWIKPWKVFGLFHETSSLAKPPSRRPKTPTSSEESKKDEEELNSTAVPEAAAESRPSTPTSSRGEKEETSILLEPFQDEPKKTSEKKKRIRRRSTSSSSSPPHPASSKRASSVEKFISDKSESKTPPKEDLCSGDEKVTDKTSPSSGVPTGLFPTVRRTSGRRSKSPAYLKESALYGLTKRKRNNSAVSETPTSAETESPLPDADDLSSESSSKSFNSSSSDANRSSPLTLWAGEPEQNRNPEQNKKPERKRTKRKSGDKKLSQIDEESGGSLLKRSAAYDIFDDDVPSIELERSSGDAGRKPKVSSKKRKVSADKQENVASTTEEYKKEISSSVNPAKSLENEDQPLAEPSTSDKPLLDSLVNATSPITSYQDADDKTSEQQSDSNGCSPRSSERSNNSDENESHPASGSSSISGESPSNQSNDEIEADATEQKSEDINQDRDKCEEANKADSESDGEDVKNKQKKRKKPKKKKKRPAPPKAPIPLKQEDLASMCPDDRIQTMIDRMEELRKLYQLLKQEVSWIDRKRKRAKRREQEAAEQSAKKMALQSPNKQSEQGSSSATNQNPAAS